MPGIADYDLFVLAGILTAFVVVKLVGAAYLVSIGAATNVLNRLAVAQRRVSRGSRLSRPQPI